jgi:predicted glycogen debranching enzyme
MDARVGDRVITPRRGRAVEINALWYNALGVGADLIEWLEGPAVPSARELRRMQARVRDSFVREFWFEEGGYLFDVIDGMFRDATIRPNQIFALSLPRPLLDPKRARSVFAVVKRELYTPLGLRSLAPCDRDFRPRFEGGVAVRDAAYHQGTVWGYLIGPYATAYLNVFGRKGRNLDAVRRMLDPFRAHLLEAGLGTVSEIFDGDPPHRPAGCISQAWSVAELLRVIHEELGDRP